jgi:hypothetical protein
MRGRRPQAAFDRRFVDGHPDEVSGFLDKPVLHPGPRKEVIQPQVPLRLPCYDFAPVADLTVVGCPPLRGQRTGFG